MKISRNTTPGPSFFIQYRYLLVVLTGGRFIYAPCDGSFRDLEHADLEAFAAKEPPENCPVCPVKAHKAEAQEPHLVPGGFAWHGSEYHLHDFVFIKTSEGVSYLGQIKEFAERRQASDVEVCLLLLFGVDGLMPGFDEVRIGPVRFPLVQIEVDKAGVAPLLCLGTSGLDQRDVHHWRRSRPGRRRVQRPRINSSPSYECCICCLQDQADRAAEHDF